MKKTAVWLAVISIIIFVIAWGIIGLKILDGNYVFMIEAYAALVSLVIFIVCALYMKITDRCPHCGKMKQSFGKYCPYCGKEFEKTN
ncbi:MAG: zinc ribbon domain-containing protein [Lachnospiraceae bacterium]|nr:zinc ribbon domain-containing protein [Lachnospiraceae bacterium]